MPVQIASSRNRFVIIAGRRRRQWERTQKTYVYFPFARLLSLPANRRILLPSARGDRGHGPQTTRLACQYVVIGKKNTSTNRNRPRAKIIQNHPTVAIQPIEKRSIHNNSSFFYPVLPSFTLRYTNNMVLMIKIFFTEFFLFASKNLCVQTNHRPII